MVLPRVCTSLFLLSALLGAATALRVRDEPHQGEQAAVKEVKVAAPIVVAAAPAAKAAAPVAVAAAPAAKAAAPVAVAAAKAAAAAPAAKAAAPVAVAAAPAAKAAAPVAVAAAPVAKAAAPVAAAAAKAAAAAPAVKAAAPVAAAAALATKAAAPVAVAAAPAVKAAAPVAVVAAPAAKAAAPVVVAAAPVAKAAAPVVVAAAPVAKAAATVVPTKAAAVAPASAVAPAAVLPAKPVVQAKPPVLEAKPASEATKPVAAKPAEVKAAAAKPAALEVKPAAPEVKPAVQQPATKPAEKQTAKPATEVKPAVQEKPKEVQAEAKPAVQEVQAAAQEATADKDEDASEETVKEKTVGDKVQDAKAARRAAAKAARIAKRQERKAKREAAKKAAQEGKEGGVQLNEEEKPLDLSKLNLTKAQWKALGAWANASIQEAQHKRWHKPGAKRDLVLMHVPFNFGHTMERIGLFSEWTSTPEVMGVLFGDGPGEEAELKKRKIGWDFVKKYSKPNAEVWGHFHPDLQLLSNKTKCNMYFTPQKYWPTDLAKKYFGDKQIFGFLRDPAERLVAMFRGNVFGYGGGFGEQYHQRCDVNAGVKRMMKDYIKSGDKFFQECAFLPQSEYFEGDFGIEIPVDTRRFPNSANELFQQHGYYDFFIRQKDILHVQDCWNIWSGDLDAETKALIRQVYKKDYELLCRHFGYCNPYEDTCVSGVAAMCPPRVLQAMSWKWR